MPITIYQCLRCGREWARYKPGRPVRCQNCKSKLWDRPLSETTTGRPRTRLPQPVKEA